MLGVKLFSVLILVLSFKEADISHLRDGCISVAVEMIPLQSLPSYRFSDPARGYLQV